MNGARPLTDPRTTHLLRYAARSPVALSRLSRLADGRVGLREQVRAEVRARWAACEAGVKDCGLK